MTSISKHYDIEETTISKHFTSISVYPDIEVLSISKNAASISYPDIVVLSFDIEESLSESARAAAVAPARHWTQSAVYTIYCASSV